MVRRRAGLSASLLAGLALAGPARAEECPFPGQRPTLTVRLFMSGATPSAWARFLATDATRLLPSGFTVYSATGQWMDPRTHRISRERTEVIEVADADSPDFRARVATLAETYKRRFHQQSVGMLTNTGCGAF